MVVARKSEWREIASSVSLNPSSLPFLYPPFPRHSPPFFLPLNLARGPGRGISSPAGSGGARPPDAAVQYLVQICACRPAFFRERWSLGVCVVKGNFTNNPLARSVIGCHVTRQCIFGKKRTVTSYPQGCCQL